MSYNNIRKKLNKYAEGGKMIPKYQTPAGVLEGTFEERMKQKQLRQLWGNYLGLSDDEINDFTDNELRQTYLDQVKFENTPVESIDSPTVHLLAGIDYGTSAADKLNAQSQTKNANLSKEFQEENKIESAYRDAEDAPDSQQAQLQVLNQAQLKEALKAKQMQQASVAMGVVGNVANQALQVADELTMGDKNFNSQSQAIDQVTHGVSGALMKSGNPYCIAAGVALEGLNFITKAGGKTVPGYDVNINNSGYGSLGHLESESGRIWDNWNGTTARKLARRNEQARMALTAADISQDQAYEQEARTNSVSNVLEANRVALAGGIDTNLLAS